MPQAQVTQYYTRCPRCTTTFLAPARLFPGTRPRLLHDRRRCNERRALPTISIDDSPALLPGNQAPSGGAARGPAMTLIDRFSRAAGETLYLGPGPVGSEIAPRIYGQFIEHLDRC